MTSEARVPRTEEGMALLEHLENRHPGYELDRALGLLDALLAAARSEERAWASMEFGRAAGEGYQRLAQLQRDLDAFLGRWHGAGRNGPIEELASMLARSKGVI